MLLEGSDGSRRPAPSSLRWLTTSMVSTILAHMSERKPEGAGSRRKPVEYNEGRDAAQRFNAAVKQVLLVPKARILELEVEAKKS